MKRVYNVNAVTGVYAIDEFERYNKPYTSRHGYVKNRRFQLYGDLDDVIEQFRTFYSDIVKTSEVVVVTEYILSGSHLGYDEDGDEIETLVAPLSSPSVELLADLGCI